jgi:hypothetical protein
MTIEKEVVLMRECLKESEKMLEELNVVCDFPHEDNRNIVMIAIELFKKKKVGD